MSPTVRKPDGREEREKYGVRSAHRHKQVREKCEVARLPVLHEFSTRSWESLVDDHAGRRRGGEIALSVVSA
jgi:hypothetical protein